MDHPAGESDDGALRVDFDRRLRLEFHGSRITSDAGLLAYRELDDALGLTDIAGAALSECRRGKNTRHMLAGLFRQSVFGRLAGYEDVNDADRLAHDPAMRAVVDRTGLDRQAASTSQMGRFETGWLTSEANLAALAHLSGAWIDRVHARRPQTTIVLDMDSSVSETHGAQEGSAYNGHFGCTCYHPLFVFNQFGDLERCSLRSGNVHSAADWRDVLVPVVARYRGGMKRRYFRGDAAYANPGIYEFLEAEGYKYTIRLPANAVLQERIGWLLKRPVGRPPRDVRRYYASFSYQAASWTRSRRVVAKVEWHPGELYPRVGFIVTNMTRPPERVVMFYNQRGTAEQYIKEGKNAIVWTRLSCRRFAANAVRLQLHALAYNLANFLRTLTLPETVSHWSMTTLRDRLVKIGAKIVRHGRSITFQMAEVMVSRGLFQQILDAITALRPSPPARC
ncbi:MAG: IS1380 family transposase [Planctomycetes bacterium]|nr:IS1380 family transposase [Planctomycetota bacterium]